MNVVLKRGLLTLMLLMLSAGLALAEPGDKLAAILQKDIKAAIPLIPADYQKSDKFAPGAGESVGKVDLVMGDAYVMHKGVKVAYRLQREDALFQGDTLVTLDASKLQAKLNDQSGFALAPQSKFSLDSVVYDDAKGQRNTLVNLAIGRVRVVANKVRDSRPDDYQMKTPTATLGMRGSDFIVGVLPAEEMESSANKPWYARLSLVPEAHAQFVPWVTMLLTGPQTSISLVGAIGPMQTLGPLSVSSAMFGGAATSPLAISFGAFSGAAGAVGGGAASLEMPRRSY